MADVDFEKLVLSKNEIKLLKRLKKDYRLIIEYADIGRLRRLHLINENCKEECNEYGEYIYDGTVSLSFDGKLYFEYKSSLIKSFLLKSIFVPILITVATYGIIELIKYLLQLL